MLDYLGMKFDYSVKGEVKISMKHYVDKIIEEYPIELRNKVISTPSTVKLFEVRKDAKKLDNNRSKTFHRIVAQLLYIVKRARPDLAPAVLFLTTRVTCPDEDNWRKVRYIIKNNSTYYSGYGSMST